MFKKAINSALVTALIAIAVACKPRVYNNAAVKLIDETTILGEANLPQLTDAVAYLPELQKRFQKVPNSVAKQDLINRIAKYLAFMGVPAQSDLSFSIIKRLSESSTQFLVCENLENWDCLEADPAIAPLAPHRQGAVANLGKRIDVDEPLQMQLFFTELWRNKMVNQKEVVVAPKDGPTLANKLADKITAFGTKSIAMALFGLDDITTSMKPVFDAFMTQKGRGAQVRAVMDIEGAPKAKENPPYVFSYFLPSFKPEHWILNEPMSQSIYEYKESPQIIRLLNEGTTSEQQTMARLEFPIAGIMHNKFLVFEDSKGQHSVWSGTANTSQECMGAELNANVGVFIQNDAVARSFLTQFNHMFEIDKTTRLKQKDYYDANGSEEIFAGRFHTNKVPVSNRYFKFSDGNEVRVHFSPTDDAEHRLHIPMIHSARAGDILRISMFVSSGDEYVRAIQLAAKRGVDIRIVHGATNGMGAGSWYVDAFANLFMPNPYEVPSRQVEGKLIGLLSDWQKLNHHKSATLTRADGRVEIFIAGSQNWTLPGNDINDENSIAVRNLKHSVPGGDEYNKHFDEKLMTSSITIETSRSRRNR